MPSGQVSAITMLLRHRIGWPVAKGGLKVLTDALPDSAKTLPSKWMRGTRPDPKYWPTIEAALGFAPGTLERADTHPLFDTTSDVTRNFIDALTDEIYSRSSVTVRTVDLDELRGQLTQLVAEVARLGRQVKRLADAQEKGGATRPRSDATSTAAGR